MSDGSCHRCLDSAKTIIRNNYVFSIVFGGLLGIAFFMAAFSPDILVPTDIGWLMTKVDPRAHFLGWHFFRNEAWTFPPGIIKNYAIPIGASIGNTDSIPLLAFIFKPFSGILPENFQYFGLWVLLCYMLTGVFGILLTATVTENPVIRVLGGAFFVLSPALLNRFDMGHIQDTRLGGHLALMGHWIIIAALYLIFREKQGPQTTVWMALISISALVHPYLHVMAFALFVAFIGKALIEKRIKAASAVINITAGVSITVLCFFLSGFFSLKLGSYSAGGISPMDLNALFNPMGRSALLGALPADPVSSEGFQYLGAGMIFLCLLAIAGATVYRPPVRKIMPFLPLVFVCLALTVYSLTPAVYFNGHKLAAFEPVGIYRFISGVYRASGRMFWPVSYLIVFLSVAFFAKKTPRVGVAALSIALILQVVDSSGAFEKIRRETSDQTWHKRLTSPFWEDAALRYKKILFVQQSTLSYEYFAYFAASRGMKINVGHLARYSPEFSKFAGQLLADFNRCEFEKDALYVINKPLLGSLLKTCNADKYGAVKYVDGFIVVLPGWDGPPSGVGILDQVPKDYFRITPDDRFFDIGRIFSFTLTNMGKALYPEGYEMHFTYRWITAKGDVVLSTGFTSILLADLKPGESAPLKMNLLMPNVPGRYLLVLKMDSVEDLSGNMNKLEIPLIVP